MDGCGPRLQRLRRSWLEGICGYRDKYYTSDFRNGFDRASRGNTGCDGNARWRSCRRHKLIYNHNKAGTEGHAATKTSAIGLGISPIAALVTLAALGGMLNTHDYGTAACNCTATDFVNFSKLAAGGVDFAALTTMPLCCSTLFGSIGRYIDNGLTRRCKPDRQMRISLPTSAP